MRGSLLIISLVLCLGVATVYGRSLSSQEIEKVKEIRQILFDIDHRASHHIIEELERTPYPSTSLNMKEAMAKTFAQLVQEQDVQGQDKKQWLYSMITLNMAYLQFVGTKHYKNTDTALNMLIRRKLREFLPADIDSQPGFIQSVD